MLNNPMMKMFVQQTISKNPQAKQLYENLKGKSAEELKQYAMNVAQSKGVDLSQFMSQYGITI
jgi:hypothetical protein